MRDALIASPAGGRGVVSVTGTGGGHRHASMTKAGEMPCVTVTVTQGLLLAGSGGISANVDGPGRDVLAELVLR